MKISLTVRIVLFFMLLAAGLLTTVGVLSYRSGRESLTAAAISEMQATAVEKDAELNGWTDNCLAGLQLFTHHPNVAELAASLTDPAPAPAEARSALRRELASQISGPHGSFTEVFVLAPDSGKVLVSTRRSQEGKSHAIRPYFENGKTGLYLSQAYYSTNLGGLAIVASAPFRAPEGRLVAVLAARIDLAALTDIAQRRTGVRQTEEAFLINAGGFPITQPQFLHEPVALRHPLDTETVRRCAAGNSGVLLTSDYRGVPCIAVYRWDVSHHFGLIVKIDQAEAFAPVRAFARQMILISDLGLLAAGVLAWFLARTITRPLRRLQTSMQHFAGGTPMEPLPDSGGDEVAALAGEFNQMAAQVTECTAELTKSNAALLMEIEERKRAEQKLQLFRALIERSSDGIEVVDPATGRFLDVNEGTCRMLGYTREEMLALTMFEVTEGIDRATFEAGNARVEKSGHTVMETLHHRKDGIIYPVEVSLSVITLDRVYMLAIVRDITGRKQLEEQLFQARKMETVGKLAGGVAHEFNSLLTVIIGQSELLVADLPAGSPLVENATEIIQAAHRAATLSRQLLAYGRQQFLRAKPLDLNRVLAGMDGGLRELLAGKAVDLNLVPAPGLHLVQADASQMEQVVINLVTNACEAMPKGGRLTLETANVTLGQEFASRFPELKPGDYVRLAVTDTGAGMSAEVQAHAFEPFFTTKDIGQGAGLGLSTCHGFIKQSGGHIRVASEVGRGTTCEIYLPRLADTSEPKP